MSARILVIEDDPGVSAMLRTVLEGEGYNVITLDDGARVRAVVERAAPAVIVLDIMMPTTDGVAVLADLATLEPRPPVIVASAYLPQTKGEELVAPWPGTRYLSKPLDLYGAGGLLAVVAGLIAAGAT